MPAAVSDGDADSRLFVVCGKHVEEDVLVDAFQPFGIVQSIKVVRDKGVAYVKYERASCAAAAMEALHETVLADGRTRLKVLLAEAPTARRAGATRSGSGHESESTQDPDNVPPRSRLFLVVPKTGDPAAIEGEMAQFPGLQYCKTDLMADKGIVFCKFCRASQALAALETIGALGTVAGYKVKCMLAEPKSNRGGTRTESASGETSSPATSAGRSADAASHREQRGVSSPFQSGVLPQLSRAHSSGLPHHRQSPATPSNSYAGLGQTDLNPSQSTAMGNLASIVSLNSIAALQAHGAALQAHGIASLAQANLASAQLAANSTLQGNWLSGSAAGGSGGNDFPSSSGGAALGFPFALGGTTGLGLDVGSLSGGRGGLESLSLGGFSYAAAQHSLSSADSLSASGASGIGRPVEGISRKRLFVVVHKAAQEEGLTRLFRSFPGMESCDLKRDRLTGQSKGFCYVSYATREEAGAAMEALNGVEYPQHCGQRMKVMYAEPAAASGSRAPGSRVGLQSAAARVVPSDSVESAAYAGLMPQLDDESSSRHRPLVSADDAIVSSPPRVPLGAIADEAMERAPLPSEGSISIPVVRDESATAQSAVTEQLAHLSTAPKRMPLQSQPRTAPTAPATTGPVPMESSSSKPARKQSQEAKPVFDAEWDDEDAVPDDKRLFTVLTRPLPDYAIHHVFSQHGPVERVRLQSDTRYAVVEFVTAEAAQMAMARLNGTDICGEALTISVTDPLQNERNSKRPRVAE